MKSLYHIEKEYAEIAAQLMDNGGEITPELEVALHIAKEELQVKATNYAFVIKQILADSVTIETEILRLQLLRKRREKIADKLKERIGDAMKNFGIEKVESPLISLSLRNSESVEILSMELLDKEYIVTKTTQAPDKAMIKDAIKAGQVVVGAIIKQNQNLQIK